MPVFRTNTPKSIAQKHYTQRGPTGLTGAGGAIENELELPAGENLSGNRAVCLNDGLFYYADKDTEESVLSIVGITKNAALAGINVKTIFYGLMSELTWSWAYPAPVFLGNNGQLTQTVPTTGFFVQIGSAVSPTSLMVDVKTVIKLI